MIPRDQVIPIWIPKGANARQLQEIRRKVYFYVCDITCHVNHLHLIGICRETSFSVPAIIMRMRSDIQNILSFRNGYSELPVHYSRKWHAPFKDKLPVASWTFDAIRFNKYFVVLVFFADQFISGTEYGAADQVKAWAAFVAHRPIGAFEKIRTDSHKNVRRSRLSDHYRRVEPANVRVPCLRVVAKSIVATPGSSDLLQSLRK